MTDSPAQTPFKSRDGRPVMFIFDSPIPQLAGELQPPAEIVENILDQIDNAKPTGSVIVMLISGLWEAGAVVPTEDDAKREIAIERGDCEHCDKADCPVRTDPFKSLYETMPQTVYADGTNVSGFDVIEIEISPEDLGKGPFGFPGLGRNLLN